MARAVSASVCSNKAHKRDFYCGEVVVANANISDRSVADAQDGATIMVGGFVGAVEAVAGLSLAELNSLSKFSMAPQEYERLHR